MATRKRASNGSSLDQDASRLRDAIHALGEYGHVTVLPQRGHLNVHAGDKEPVARATPLGDGQYGLSFHSHTGRWEPMPFAGDPSAMAEALVTALGIYLERSDFSDRNSGSDH